MSLDYHTAPWRKRRLYQGRRGGGAGEEQDGSCNAAPSSSAGCSPRRARAPGSKVAAGPQPSAPTDGSGTFLSKAGGITIFCEEPHVTEKSQITITWKGGHFSLFMCTTVHLKKVTHTSGHSVFNNRQGGDAERCMLQHTGNKRKLCEKVLSTANSCCFVLCYFSILRILIPPMDVVPRPFISILGITARLMAVLAMDWRGRAVM